MKKIITILAIALFSVTFVACEKEEIETSTSVRWNCRDCGSNDIQVFYPPRSHSHLPPSYVCNVCGKGGVLR